MLALVVAACGGDDDTSGDGTAAPGDDTGPAVSEPATPTEPPPADSASPETIGTVALGSSGADGGGPTRIGYAEDQIASPDVNVRPADWDPEGELVIGYGGPPRQLDPAFDLGLLYIRPIYDTLTELDNDNNVHPRLARGWEYPDAKTMVLHLRDGVTFQDGTPLDAAAVVTNLERYQTLPGSLQASTLASIESMEVVDELTVQLNLSSGGAELPVMFSQGAGMMISPKAIEETPDAIATDGAGASGPYTVESFTAGESATYVANPDFWDLRKGLLAKLTIVGITDTTQRINALEAGDLNASQIFGRPVADAKSALEAGEIEGILVNLTGLQYGAMLRDDKPPFDNPMVREAVALAIDKDGYAAALYDGACTPATQFFGPGHWAHAPELENMYSYDPDRARELIAESGVTDLNITMRSIAVYSAAAEVLQSMLQDVGFTVTLEPSESPAEFGDGVANITAMGIGQTYDPSQLAASYAIGAYHLVGDNQGEMEALIAEGNDPTASVDDAAAAYRQIWNALYGGYRIIATCNAQHVWRHDGTVANMEDLAYQSSGSVDFTYLYVAK